MIISPSIVTAAKQHGSKQIALTAPPGEPLTQVSEVVDLLAESTSPAAQRGARVLLGQMAAAPWSVVRGAHRSASDPSPHGLIDVDRTRYHLRPDGQMKIFDITNVVDKQMQRPSGNKLWVGPGA